MIHTSTSLQKNEYTPSEVSAPGETLIEIIDERGMTQMELAERLGLSQKTINEIIKGKAPISQETALGLERVLGVPAGFWNRFEAAYRESLARVEDELSLSVQTPWLSTIPWKEAAKKNWIPTCSGELEQLKAVLAYFGVASIRQYDEVYGKLAVQWRRVQQLDSDSGAVALWLRQGEILASRIDTQPYDPKAFERCLTEIRPLTRETEPRVFVNTLKERCAQAGVAVTFVQELPMTRACGAARWLTPSKALIQLSLRYKTNDSLWFTFYHEAAHILRHSKKEVFLDDNDSEKNDIEREADAFAENTLIPSRELRLFLAFGTLSRHEIQQFAEKIDVAPAIVLGRLQKEKRVPWDRFADLKVHYKWVNV